MRTKLLRRLRVATDYARLKERHAVEDIAALVH
jgi:hypothetical protein